ncbi:cas scaffolding protein family member 4 isoform X2 [Siphateles boraxobius]|uniref:cas scaffolding protein family member 4 isoform X2 n=1 Tax=Siphateles boraxobius TaxID=180520 RepID=UPI004063BFA9
METLYAKALYDNTAETEDELAFRKGDIIMVLEKIVAGSIGWWMCSLHGRQGLAPANRLAPLSPAEAKKLCTNLSAQRDLSNHSHQNIYQTPNATKPPENPIYEDMNTLYKVPYQANPSLDKHTAQEDPEGTRSPHKPPTGHLRTGTEIYDVPSPVRKPSLFTPSTRQPLERETLLTSSTELHKRYEMLQNARCTTATKKKVATIHPLVTQDPNYDIPIPSISISEDIQKPPCGFITMPKPSKSEWIYDVPLFPQKQGCEPGYYGTIPPKTINSNQPLYDALPTHIWPERMHGVVQPLYDIPKPSNVVVQSCTDTGKSTNLCIYDVPPCHKQKDTPVVLPKHPSLPEMDSKSHEPLDYRGKPGLMYDQLPHWPSRNRTMSRQPVEGMIRKDNENDKDHQRSSTVSTSSTASSSSRSSCDSLMLSSPEPEPLREVTLSQEEAGNRLLELQEVVHQSVPKLMLFVSSQWRSKEHLEQHLHEIRTAAEDVTDSVNCFLNFALDVRGNAQRLTDSNLQTRLLKQLSIVEDSGLILQQAASALRDLGWLLDKLVQDAGQSQTPDHLERFVMVARTVPEDVKRLVSILNANGKLLFRVPTKEPDMAENVGSSKWRSKREPMVDSGIDESDYVQLQSLTNNQNQQGAALNQRKTVIT